MVDDPLTVLETELVAAARRQAGRASARSHSALDARTRGLRPSIGGAIATVAAVAAAAIAVGAVVLLGGHSREQAPAAQTHTATASSVPLQIERSISALIGNLSASPAGMRASEAVMSQLGLGRYTTATYTTGAVTAPGRVKIVLWEVATQPAGQSEVDVLAAVVRGRVLAQAPASQVSRRGLLLIYGYTKFATRVAVIVPNRVARVRLTVARLGSLVAGVHRNIAAFAVNGFGLVRIQSMSRITWYSRNGQVLRRVAASGPLP
jgi:hypothetical protein